MGEFPKRKKRSESFVGMHFDLHAGADCTEMGKHVTPEMVERIISEVQPDYIQCDCKGHPGYASYPTKVAYPAPGFVRDQLRIWREVTARHGVALYMHYSGVIDGQAVAHHPDWAAIGPDGEPHERATSNFGPYVDELLIPQLEELIDTYDIDGVWVDGECWGSERDWSPAAVEAFRQETGIEDVPWSPADPHWIEWSDFHREQFRRYLAHYVDALHAHAPDFQIASNWAYTDHMPEPVRAHVDYISGDYSRQNSLNAARYQGRCLQLQGKPWDLMAWAFSGRGEDRCNCTKGVAQLQQEAAIVLALGGGFQAYFKQKRDGSIYGWQMKLMGETARFCRERQALCHRSQPVHQVAVLYSSQAHYRDSERLFQPRGEELSPLKGTLNALLDSQLSVEIVMEHHLRGQMSQYPLIVVPEWGYLDADLIAELKDYVRDGGKLLLVGPQAAQLFEGELDVTLQGEVDGDAKQWLKHGDWLVGLRTPSQKVVLGAEATPYGQLFAENDDIGPWEPAASIRAYGNGQIAATYMCFGERYIHGKSFTARDFMGDLARTLLGDDLRVKVSGSHMVDVTLATQGTRLLVNLVNSSGPHADNNEYVFDEVLAVGPLEVQVAVAAEPQSVRLEPEGTALEYAYADGWVTVHVPRVAIHAIIVIE